MQLNLIRTRVNHLVLKQVKVEEAAENKLEFDLSTFWDKETPSHNFSVFFDFKLYDSSGYELNLHYEGMFETDAIIDEEFMSSPWPEVNGAAIVYPFMRAFVSTLTVNSGLEVAVIPSVNFQGMYQKQISSNESD
jgi:preprotein translocase subunit SecB